MFLGMILCSIGFAISVGGAVSMEKVSRVLLIIIGIIIMIIGAIRLDNVTGEISASACLKNIEVYNS